MTLGLRCVHDNGWGSVENFEYYDVDASIPFPSSPASAALSHAAALSLIHPCSGASAAEQEADTNEIAEFPKG